MAPTVCDLDSYHAHNIMAFISLLAQSCLLLTGSDIILRLTSDKYLPCVAPRMDVGLQARASGDSR